MYSFQICTAVDLLDAAEESFRDYLEDGLSSRKAVTSAMLCWHVAEWIYRESESLQAEFPTRASLHRQITSECPSLQVMQDITNGTKHGKPNPPRAGIVSTEPRPGAFAPAFSGGLERAEFTIHRDDGTNTTFDIECRRALEYLRDLVLR